MEMAQAHCRLGCKVTVLEALKALGRSFPDHAAVVLDRVRAEGVDIHEGTAAQEVRFVDGKIEIGTSDGKTIAGNALLVAVGRKPNIDKLDLEAAGIKQTRAGIEVNQSLKTTNRRVYAIGDVSGGPQFTHVAGYHAGVVIKSALFGMPSKVRTDHIPSATYTDPEIAEVGLSDEQARQRYGDSVEAASFDFDENDRALAEGYTKGQARVLVVKGRPVGASIVGPQAGELIQVWSLAIANKMKMTALANMIAPYPTLGEVNKRAAGSVFFQAAVREQEDRANGGFGAEILISPIFPWRRNVGIGQEIAEDNRSSFSHSNRSIRRDCRPDVFPCIDREHSA